jgi:light-regulated signal transduction histidine kinase (bacteriophytochrome)
MHPVCSHDLPNQAVALQSALQLFEWDEAAHLTPQGREYFNRLQSIAKKTVVLVQHLKELIRLHKHAPRPEKLGLAQMVRELQAETLRSLPEVSLTWNVQSQAEHVIADRRLLQQGVVHLFRHAATSLGGKTLAVELHIQPRRKQVEWTMTVRVAAAEAPTPMPADSPERRLTLALAQECLAATDVICQCKEGVPRGAVVYSLVIPDAPRHG